ncbi:MAG: phosphatidate cytidylyltransferase [Gammaproteobacteria bacterium]
MLKLRLLTALILLPLIVALVLRAPTWGLALATGAVVVAGAWEWAHLSALGRFPAGPAFVLLVAILLVILWFTRADPRVVWTVMLLALAWWLFAIVWVSAWRHEFPRALKLICGLLILLPAWLATIDLHASVQGPRKLLFLLVLIWAADSAAYFAGRAFGQHKLAPAVSPGKTWEGVVGGTVGLLVVAWLGAQWFLPLQGYWLFLICLVTGWWSIVGDLAESLFKRQAGVKDSGGLFPGHGGVLDRIDSLTVAVPIFWLGLALTGWWR